MKSIGIITIGNILLTGAYAFLTVPNNMIDGGVTSTSLLISHILGIDITYITTTLALLLLLFGLVTFGKHFFFKTAYSCFCYIVFFNFFHLLNIMLTIPPIICIIVAGILVGLGHYLCLSQNSSVIGYDVIALFVHKNNKKWELATVLRIIGILILIIGTFVFGPLAVIYGIIFIIIETEVIHFLSSKKPVCQSMYIHKRAIK